MPRAADGLRRYWWLALVGAVVVGTGFSVLFASSSSADTEATAKLVAVDETRLAIGLGLNTQVATSQAQLPVDVQYLTSSEAKAAVTAVLGRTAPEIEIESTPEVVTLTILDSSAEAAQAAVEAYSGVLRQHRLTAMKSDLAVAESSLDQRLALVRSQIDALISGLEQAPGTDAATGAVGLQYSELVRAQTDLQNQQLGIKQFKEQSIGGFEVISTSIAESSSRLPLIGGVLFGGACGVAAACYLGLAERKLRSRRSIEQIAGEGSVLAVVPHNPTEEELDGLRRAIDHRLTTTGSIAWHTTSLSGSLPPGHTDAAGDVSGAQSLHLAVVGFGRCHADDLAISLHTSANTGEPIGGVILTDVPRRRLRASAR